MIMIKYHTYHSNNKARFTIYYFIVSRIVHGFQIILQILNFSQNKNMWKVLFNILHTYLLS